MEIKDYKDSYKELIWLNSRYKFIHHGFANLLEIQKYTYKKNWFGVKKWYWKRIYFGHVYLIKQAINFYDENQK